MEYRNETHTFETYDQVQKALLRKQQCMFASFARGSSFILTVAFSSIVQPYFPVGEKHVCELLLLVIFELSEGVQKQSVVSFNVVKRKSRKIVVYIIVF